MTPKWGAASLLALAKGVAVPSPAEAAENPWHNPGVFHPGDFAAALVGHMNNHYSELIDAPTREAMATYKRALAALVDACPELAGVPFDHPVHLMDEAVFAWAGSSFDAGVRIGAAIEHMRRELMGPVGGEK